jgi:hypothetical protein
MTDALQVMWKTPKHVFVRRGNLIVQVRGEEHSIAALQAQETGLRLARAQVRAGPIGALLVIEANAPAPTGEVAKKQRELVGGFKDDERIHVCIVFEGAGTGVALKRTLARALFRGARRHIASSVREGARWMSQAIGTSQNEIIDFVESQRPK